MAVEMYRLTKKDIASARTMMCVELDKRAIDAAERLRAPDRALAQDWARVDPAAALALTRRGLVGSPVDLAKDIGHAYARNIGALYASQYAGVRYGRGGEEMTIWPYKGHASRYPAVFHNAGARWEVQKRALVLLVENSRGTLVDTVQLPASLRTISTMDAATHGDLFTTQIRPGLRQRWGASGARTGLALQCAAPDGTGHYWEHGDSVDECRTAQAAKLALFRDASKARRESALEGRRLRLLARISTAIEVTRAHALAIGACEAGIRAWCERAGIPATREAMPARDVVRLSIATGERRAMAAAMMAARRALA